MTRSEIRPEKLGARADVGGATRHTELYAAVEDGRQVGLLSIDFFPGVDEAEVYEIFVMADDRRTAIGSFLVEQAEALARDRGYASVILKPCPVDDDPPIETLRHWYARRGYETSKHREEMMIKRV